MPSAPSFEWDSAPRDPKRLIVAGNKLLDFAWASQYLSALARQAKRRRSIFVGSVIKKRRKKMRKHKQRKLLKRQRHKRKR
jgi:hypothetical protein